MADETTPSTTEQMLWKIDRSLAVLGIVAIAIVSVFYYRGNEGVQIVSTAIAGLVGYIGGRSGK